MKYIFYPALLAIALYGSYEYGRRSMSPTVKHFRGVTEYRYR